MNYTPEEIAELLKDKPHQPHYIAAMVRKAIQHHERIPITKTKTVMMPRELTKEEAIAVRVMTAQRLDVKTRDWVDMYNLSPAAINAIYRAAVELLGE